MSDCDAGCSPWGLSFLNPRMRALLRLSRRAAWQYVCIRRNESYFGRVRYNRGEGAVKPCMDPMVDAIRPCVKFVSAGYE
jgi:hypothetical protein